MRLPKGRKPAKDRDSADRERARGRTSSRIHDALAPMRERLTDTTTLVRKTWGRIAPKVRRALPVVGGVLALAVVALAVAGPLPAVCSACHGDLVDRNGTEAHARTSCDACHASNASEWVRLRTLQATVMPAAQLFGEGPSLTAGRPVQDAACLDCHAEEVTSQRVVSGQGLRMRHDLCVREGERCVSCHGSAGHPAGTVPPSSPVMASCLACHDGRLAPQECETCHDESEERPRNVYESGPWAAVHLDPDGTAHGLGDLDTCVSCHAPTKCVSCHGIELPHPVDFPRTHGTSYEQAPASCTQCHEQSVCDDCHGTVKMPHSETYLADHMAEATTLDDPACMNCHRVDDCDACHTRHTHPGKASGYDGPYW